MTTPKVKSAEEYASDLWLEFRLNGFDVGVVDIRPVITMFKNHFRQARADGFQEAVEMLRAAPSISGARSSLANEYADWLLEQKAKETK